MENRSGYIADSASQTLIPVEGLQRSAAVAFPIIGSGDVTGCVLLLTSETQQTPSSTEIKLAQVAASFLGKQTEE